MYRLLRTIRPAFCAYGPRGAALFAVAVVCSVMAVESRAAHNERIRRLPGADDEFRSWADYSHHARASYHRLPVAPVSERRYFMADLEPQRHRTQGRYAYFQNPHEEVPPPPPGRDGMSVVEGPPAGESLPEGQTIGEEPEDYNVQFLRQQSVLLGHGDWQVDYGLTYTLAENDIPIALVDGGGNVTGVTEGALKNRLLTVPLEFRYGLRDHLQLSIGVPLGWSSSEVSFNNFDEFTDELGIGDTSAALSFVVKEGCRYKPDVIVTLGMTAPTGNADFPLLTTLTPNSVLGEGYWAASAQLLLIHTYDPIVVFYGFGYRHRFEAQFFNPLLSVHQDVNPGEAVFYQLGVGFGVNEWITLSTSFAGQYISELQVDDDRIEGTILEPVRMRFAATINTQHKLIEPFAEIGMTDAAVDARFGIVWTHTHRRCGGCR